MGSTATFIVSIPEASSRHIIGQKMELLQADHQTAQGKIQQLENELKRLTGLTSIGGGAPGRVGNGQRVESLNDFERLSSADMRKHLRASVDKNAMPWL